MTDFHKLANQHISKLTPYQPGKPIEELQRELGITSSIKLASNENPLGASPKAMQAVLDALQHSHIYPDGGYHDLKHAIAAFTGVAVPQVTVGNGSENILELIVKSFLHPNNSAVISQYAFLTIPILIHSYGAKAHVVPASQFGHDVTAMINAITDDTRLLFLVNPNNPTGTYTNTHDFEKLLQNVPQHVLIIVDEAYCEYIAASDYPNAISYLNNYPNLIITRTFSKAYGLATLRLGYALSSPTIADILNRARLPFNVNMLAARAGVAALQDQEHVKKSFELNQMGMQQLETGLNKLRLPYIPSLGNFITIDVGDGERVYQALLREGVIVRPLKAYQLPNHIRVSIGTSEEINRFLSALEKCL